jgi:hypothetical protein
MFMYSCFGNRVFGWVWVGLDLTVFFFFGLAVFSSLIAISSFLSLFTYMTCFPEKKNNNNRFTLRLEWVG